MAKKRIRVHLMIRGRIGDDWFDIDRKLKLAAGATLGDLITRADKKGIPLSLALEKSPHLAETLMLNGERCPVAEHRDRPLADGDAIYLLSPLAGG